MTIRTAEGYYPADGHVSLVSIHVIPPDSVHDLRILTVSGNGYYTNVISTYDAEGRELSRYLHLGSLEAPVLLPGYLPTGPAVILGGTLNGYRRPVVVILDPYRLCGVSPQKDSHRLLEPALPPAEEVCYVMLPEVDVSSFSFSAYTPIARVNSVSDGAIHVDAGYAAVPYGPDLREVPVSLLFRFDRHTMRAIAVSTSTQFDILHGRLKDRGLITSTLDDAYKADILHRIEYWDGERFVFAPTRNRRYRETRLPGHAMR